jgi:hypothetical protein
MRRGGEEVAEKTPALPRPVRCSPCDSCHIFLSSVSFPCGALDSSIAFNVKEGFQLWGTRKYQLATERAEGWQQRNERSLFLPFAFRHSIIQC